MRLLLDTHTVLWFLEGNPRLSRTARDLIEDLSNERLFSAAGAWEIAIKVSLGKLELHVPYERLVPGQLLANGIALLPLLPEHLTGVLALPFHHRDPFDRMLVAQAFAEEAVLVSADPVLDAYGVRRVW
ncbi:MAG TPA: type II toxin-antitoxin system VapC family toxin [Longimicrobium sp.]